MYCTMSDLPSHVRKRVSRFVTQKYMVTLPLTDITKNRCYSDCELIISHTHIHTPLYGIIYMFWDDEYIIFQCVRWFVCTNVYITVALHEININGKLQATPNIKLS